MGFYPPASLVRDAQRRGVEVLPPDVNTSADACRIEGDGVRVGLGYIKGLGEEPGQGLRRRSASARGPSAASIDLAQRAPLDRPGARGARRVGGLRLVRLATATAPLAPRAGTTFGVAREPAARSASSRFPLEPTTEIPDLPEQTPWERMLADYRTTSLSVGVHPLELLRPHLPAEVARASISPISPRLPVTTIPATGALFADASQVLGVALEPSLAALGKSIGPPWKKDHKEAAAAALVALHALG